MYYPLVTSGQYNFVGIMTC
uniref:Uncharacterized protein n=1 Tax=Arundo donax TaxID=35708 RepID=A0A0A9HQI4_ARUDO